MNEKKEEIVLNVYSETAKPGDRIELTDSLGRKRIGVIGKILKEGVTIEVADGNGQIHKAVIDAEEAKILDPVQLLIDELRDEIKAETYTVAQVRKAIQFMVSRNPHREPLAKQVDHVARQVRQDEWMQECVKKGIVVGQGQPSMNRQERRRAAKQIQKGIDDKRRLDALRAKQAARKTKSLISVIKELAGDSAK
jgi:hypothetical protein